MPIHTFIDKMFSLLGIPQQPPPRNDFRNPIWGDDDDDDGEELYDNRTQINVFQNPNNLHHEITRQMMDMLKSFGNLIGDSMPQMQDEHFKDFYESDVNESSSNEYHNSNLRDYYLKPGYHQHNHKEDIDLDGKVSSQDISGLLKSKSDPETNTPPFDGSIVPGRSFCQTIITTSITKPDGTIETRRIVKNRNGITEDTTTKMGLDDRSPMNPGLTPSDYYHNILSDFTNRWKNFY